MKILLSCLLLVTAASAWDLDTSKRMLYYSYATYCPQTNIQHWNCKWCSGPAAGLNVTAIAYDKPTNTQAYIGYNARLNEIVVAFRGTVATSIKDWIDDLKFWKANTTFDGIPGAYIAKGFNDCWNGLKPAVRAAVQSNLNLHRGASLWITGHSLGGALSTLAAMDFSVTGLASASLYTFGSPRVGDRGFASAYNSRVGRTFRVTNNRDLVPHLPPEIASFHHVTTEVWERDSNYKVCSSTDGEDSTCSDSVTLPDSIYDHLHYMGIAEDC